MPVSESRKAANAKWDSANLKRLSLAIPISLYEQLKNHTDASNETVNHFIRRAIETVLKSESPDD